MRPKTFNDATKYEFVRKFGFHACYRVRETGELILHCYSNNNECTVSVNSAARLAFNAFEPDTMHFYHLETNARSQRLKPEQLSAVFEGPDYSVFDLDTIMDPDGASIDPVSTPVTF